MLSRRAAWIVAIAATLTMTVSYIDRATIAVLAPSVTAALDISDQEYGWLAAAFSIAYLVSTPLAGWWIDRAGARRGLVGSVLVWSTVAALHALAPGLGLLFALRIALGMAEGPSFPGAAQTVQRVLPPEDRARGFGVLFTGSSVGGMLVPPLAGWLYGLAGWRVAFLGTAAIGLLWIPLWLAVTRRADVRARLDHAEHSDPADPANPAAPVTERVAFRELVRSPIVIRALIAILAAAPVVGFLQAWGAKYLVRAFEITQAHVGHYLWLPPLLFDVGAVAFGDRASRQRRAPGDAPRMLFVIATLLAASMALVPTATTAWEGMTYAGLAMAGGGGLYTLTTSDLLGRMPAGSVSLAGGILAGAQSLALIIASPLIGRAVQQTGSYDLVALVLGAWVVPGAAIWIVWRVPASYSKSTQISEPTSVTR